MPRRKKMEISIFIHFDDGRVIETKALIDSGAGGLFIDEEFAKSLRTPMQPLSRSIPVFNVDGTPNKSGVIEKSVKTTVEIEGRSRNHLFLVTALGKQRVILGYPWLEEENPDIDWRQQTIRWRTRERRNIYAMFKHESPENVNDPQLVISYIRERQPTDEEELEEIAASFVHDELTQESKDNWIKSRMTHSQRLGLAAEQAKAKPVKEIVPEELHGYLDTVFAEREIGKLPQNRSYDHKIDLQPGFINKVGVLYRQGPHHDKALREFLDENLAKGFIRKSESPLASSFFFIPKKDGKQRPVQDYRYVNSGTIKNAYPLPRIDDLIDKLRGKTLFVKMDIRWGYNNVRIREGDEWKAAFVCKYGLFEPTVMFFGLCNSPATFQAMMDDIFRIEIAQGWLVIYLDDLLLSNSGDREDMIKKCLHVLKKLWEHDLFVKPEKCEFLVTKVNFLGFVIENGKVSMDPSKLSGIADWPPPKTVSQLRSFLGFCNFYHRFIDHYADKCQWLNILLKKTQPWIWEVEQHTAFEILKVAYLKEPVLLIPDLTKPFEIEADASLYATGAVLHQEDTNGEQHPVAYYSKSLSPPERNYQVYDREFLAIIRSLREWKHYVQGSPFKTVVHSDHQNLTYYRSPQKLTQRQTRWVVEFMDYDVKLQHKAGRLMIPADALSRRHDHAKGLEADNEDVTALSEELFIKLADTELRDAVAGAQLDDKLAKEAIARLSDPLHPPVKWQIERDPNAPSCLFYDGRLYVPDNLKLRRQIVSDHHDTPVAGHPGILATSRSVRASYWWPGLSSFVRHYVDGCATCQQFKISTHPTKPSLYPIPSASPRLFGSLGIDFMTDLPLSEDGSDSIMVVVDHGLSKGIVVIPTNKTGLTAERTAQLFIDNVYSRFGLPDNTITDRGPQFDSEFFQELCKALGIRSSLTTAFHPQANGGTERANREIQLYLSIFCINNPSSWSQAIKKAEFVYNNRPHADRSQSPFELMYGISPKALPNVYYQTTPGTKERLERLDQWRKDALIAHEYARQRMKDRIKSTYQPFEIGQKVWLEGRNLNMSYNKKITTKREGPFEILEVRPPVNYRLKLPTKWQIHDVFHASLLTPYKENNVHGPNFHKPPPDIIEDQPEWEVERIVRHRGTKNRTYQVKWRGYDEYSWEAEKDLANAQDVLNDYWSRKKNVKARNR